MTLVILSNSQPPFTLGKSSTSLRLGSVGKVLRMSEDKKGLPQGSDWTHLLTDPDLVVHLGKLLQTYREVSPERREAALLRAMREIKDAAVKARALPGNAGKDATVAAEPVAVLRRPEPVEETPPFAPD